MKTSCWISLLCAVTDLTIARSEAPRTARYTADGFYPDEPGGKQRMYIDISHTIKYNGNANEFNRGECHGFKCITGTGGRKSPDAGGGYL